MFAFCNFFFVLFRVFVSYQTPTTILSQLKKGPMLLPFSNTNLVEYCIQLYSYQVTSYIPLQMHMLVPGPTKPTPLVQQSAENHHSHKVST